MLQIDKVIFLLSKKEKLNFYILIFLIFINSVLEVLGITSIIPIISITINNFFSLLKNLFFYNFLNYLNKNENFILIIFIFVGIIFVLKNLFIMFYNFFLSKFNSETSERLSYDIYKYYLNIDYKNYLKLNTSKLIYDTTEAVEVFRNTLLNASYFLLEIIVLVIIVTFLIYLNPTSTIAMLLILGIISIFFYKFFSKKNYFFGLEVKKNTKDRINVLNTSYSSMKDIKIYSGEQFYKSIKFLITY